MHFPLEGLSKVLGSGLGSAWFRLGSTRPNMHFPLEGLSKVLVPDLVQLVCFSLAKCNLKKKPSPV